MRDDHASSTSFGVRSKLNSRSFWNTVGSDDAIQAVINLRIDEMPHYLHSKPSFLIPLLCARMYTATSVIH